MTSVFPVSGIRWRKTEPTGALLTFEGYLVSEIQGSLRSTLWPTSRDVYTLSLEWFHGYKGRHESSPTPSRLPNRWAGDAADRCHHRIRPVGLPLLLSQQHPRFSD